MFVPFFIFTIFSDASFLIPELILPDIVESLIVNVPLLIKIPVS